MPLSASSSRRKCRCSSRQTFVAAEQADQAIDQAADAVPAGRERLAADERDEPGGAAVELVERQRALAFRRAQLHAREQAAEVLVALAALDEDGEPPRARG